MTKGLFHILLLSYLTSCGQNSIQVNSTVTPDTAQLSDENDIDIKALREEYTLSYSKPVDFISELKGKDGEKIKVFGKYYCLFDNGILVPGKYNLDDTTKTFKTHNFAEDLVITINGDTILKKTVTKDLFNSSLPHYLKVYAVIQEPQFEGYDSETKTFDFLFSISIPLSDIGEARKLSIRQNGTVEVSNPE